MIGWLIDSALSIFNVWILLALIYPFYRLSKYRNRNKGDKS